MSEKVLGFYRKDSAIVPLHIEWFSNLKLGKTNIFFITEEKLVPVVSLQALKRFCEHEWVHLAAEGQKKALLKWAEKEAGKKVDQKLNRSN